MEENQQHTHENGEVHQGPEHHEAAQGAPMGGNKDVE